MNCDEWTIREWTLNVPSLLRQMSGFPLILFVSPEKGSS